MSSECDRKALVWGGRDQKYGRNATVQKIYYAKSSKYAKNRICWNVMTIGHLVKTMAAVSC